MSLEFSADSLQKIAALSERYPTAVNRKQPVVLAALHMALRDFGALTDDVLKLVAKTLDLPYAHVFGVATFYTMFRREPGGKTTVRVCTNISCMLRGADDVLRAFERATGVERGESNAEFSVVEEECIAACANAPAVVCGTRYFLDVTPEQVPDLVKFLKKAPHPESEVV